MQMLHVVPLFFEIGVPSVLLVPARCKFIFVHVDEETSVLSSCERLLMQLTEFVQYNVVVLVHQLIREGRLAVVTGRTRVRALLRVKC